MTVLYKMDSRKQIRVYEIFPFGDGYRVYWGIYQGEMLDKQVTVYAKVSRTQEQQVMQEVNAKIIHKKDKGYKESIEEARASGATNQMQRLQPMLAKKYARSLIYEDKSVYVQYKYDGHRCMIFNDGNNLLAYSRGGKPINTIRHITQGMDIPVGCTLDGELYVHGIKLQSITSLVKRLQKDNAMLDYMIYDIVSDEPYRDRLKSIEALELAGRLGRGTVAPTWQVHETLGNPKFATLARELKEAVDDGYEGLMIRRGEEGYRAGNRSKCLLKYKHIMDSTFEIVDIDESKDGWAILVFDGFSATAPGTHEEKEEILDNAEDYIGLTARVEYSGLTKKGLPFHPVVTNILD